MSVAGLDTHQVVKTLKAAGFSEEQAEAVTQVVRDSQNLDLSNLVTKADLSAGLADVRSELRTGLADVRNEVRTEIAKVRTEIADTKVEIIRWVIGIGFAQAGFVIAMLRFMR